MLRIPLAVQTQQNTAATASDLFHSDGLDTTNYKGTRHETGRFGIMRDCRFGLWRKIR